MYTGFWVSTRRHFLARNQSFGTTLKMGQTSSPEPFVSYKKKWRQIKTQKPLYNTTTVAWAASFLRFLDHTQWHTTVGRTSLDEWSAHRRDLYLTNIQHSQETDIMPQAGFEPAIPAGERPQNLALDSSTTGIGHLQLVSRSINEWRCTSSPFIHLNGLVRNNFVFTRCRVRCVHCSVDIRVSCEMCPLFGRY